MAANGSTAVGNQQGGILVDGSSSNDTIGGASYAFGNVISGNQGTPTLGGSGISLANGTSNTTIAANDIGTDASGAIAVGNANDGIFIQLGLNGQYHRAEWSLQYRLGKWQLRHRSGWDEQHDQLQHGRA